MNVVGNTTNRTVMAEEKKKVEQIKNLQAYLGHRQDEDMIDMGEVNKVMMMNELLIVKLHIT